MGDRHNVRIDAFQIAQRVEMNGACPKALDPSVTKPCQMLFGGKPLHTPDFDLDLHQTFREVKIAGCNNRLGGPQIVDGQIEEMGQLPKSVL